MTRNISVWGSVLAAGVLFCAPTSADDTQGSSASGQMGQETQGTRGTQGTQGTRGTQGTMEQLPAGEDPIPAPAAEDRSMESQGASGAEGLGTGADVGMPGNEPRGRNVTGAVGGTEEKAAKSQRKRRRQSGASASSLLPARTIAELQTALKDQGTYEGEVDGIAGPRTEQAIRTFQQQQQLEVTGKLDGETLRQLGVDLAGAGVRPVRGIDSDRMRSPEMEAPIESPVDETGRSGSDGTVPGSDMQAPTAPIEGVEDPASGTQPGSVPSPSPIR